MKKKATTQLLMLLLLASFLFRVARIDYPKNYVFDEVYYAFTAQEYLKGNKEAWSWLSAAPEGFAYAWVNPPLAQEIMAFFMFLLGNTSSFAWRLPGVIAGTLAVFLVFLIGQRLFGSIRIGLFAAFLFSFDGLAFVLSRVGMLDIYLVLFLLAACYFLIKRKFFLSSCLLGAALAVKWSALAFLPAIFLFLLSQKKSKEILFYLLIPPIIYLAAYLPFFAAGFTLSDFKELLAQQFWYHSHLSATHSYSSSWWTWPLMLRPVWLFVQQQEDFISNIYISGNPAIFWPGLLSVIFGLFFLGREKALSFALQAYFFLFVLYPFSPRITFFYYYLPMLPFKILTLAWFLNMFWQKRKKLVIGYLVLVVLVFMFFYPHWTGIFVPKWFDELYYWLPSWK